VLVACSRYDDLVRFSSLLPGEPVVEPARDALVHELDNTS
jgi:hypothetical protein